ncbi:hypothetical protein PSHT_10878, partial [Puccinia striiformis]
MSSTQHLSQSSVDSNEEDLASRKNENEKTQDVYDDINRELISRFFRNLLYRSLRRQKINPIGPKRPLRNRLLLKPLLTDKKRRMMILLLKSIDDLLLIIVPKLLLNLF